MLLHAPHNYRASDEPLPPDAPSGLTLTYGLIFVGENGLTVAWTDESDNETGFQIQWAVQAGSPLESEWSGLAVVAADSVSYTYDDGIGSGHDGSLVGQTVWVRIRSYNANGVSAWVTDSLFVPASGGDFSDDFNRAGGSGLGSPWVDVAGAWDISFNKAHLVTTDGAGYDQAIVTLGADGTFSVDMQLDSVLSGIVFRQSDTNNFWVFLINGAGTVLRKIVAGVPSTVGTGSSNSAGTLSVICSGSSIDCQFGGVSEITTTDSFNAAATGGGLAAEPSVGCAATWDNFSYVS